LIHARLLLEEVQMRRWLFLALVIHVLPPAVTAYVAVERPAGLIDAEVACETCFIPGENISMDNASATLLPNRSAYETFRIQHGAGWSIFIDGNTGYPSYIGGQGIPVIPGEGNSLSMEDLGLSDLSCDDSVPLDIVEGRVKTLLLSHSDLFGVHPDDLVLMEGSGYAGEGHYLCYLNYRIHHQGIEVDGALFQVRINHGNLVDMGFTGHYSPPAISPAPLVSAKEALAILEEHLGGFLPGDNVAGPGSPLFVPVYLGEDRAEGDRVGYRLVWEMVFSREGMDGSRLCRVDAHTGEVVEFQDTTFFDVYRRIRANVYREQIGGGATLVTRVFPYMVEDSTLTSTGRNGLYTYPGGTVTCSLNGNHHDNGDALVWIDEQCTVKPSLSSTSGSLDWGGTTGQDCDNTGASYGYATEEALMAAYHVTMAKLLAYSYLPTNTWLNDPLRIMVNISGGYTCNAAFSDNTYLKLYDRQGDPECNNLGLNAGILVHETGHGLDHYDGLEVVDKGSSEVYADTMDLLYLHNSCHAEYAWFVDCDGYGNTCLDCSGIREMDYAMKTRGIPSTPKNFICTDCVESTYFDPCGREGHCTASGMGETMYDLAVRDLPGVSDLSQETAWIDFQRLFFLSRPISGAMYTCLPHLVCAGWLSNGCSVGNWYRTFRVVNDDNGNLCDGTPHGAAIYEAFNRHGIACPPSIGCPDENIDHTDCPTLGAPTLTAVTAEPCRLDLAWTGVAGAVEYRVYRNESGPDEGFMFLATVKGSKVAFSDTSVAPGVIYYYTVRAVSGNPSCAGPVSNVLSSTPYGCETCTVPAPPTGVQCSAGSSAITVTWNDDGTGDGYRVYRKKEGEHLWVLVSGDMTVTSFVDSSAVCGRNYRYRVVSYETTNGPCESEGSVASSYCTVLCCSAPGAPSLISATGDCEGVDLAWTAGSGTTNSFMVWRREGDCSSTSTWQVLVSPISGTTFRDETASYNTTYAYVVMGACDTDGTVRSPASNCLSASSLRPDPPANFSVNTSCGQVDMSWDPVAGASGYKMYRSNVNCPEGGTLLVSTTGTSFTDTTGQTGLYYDYYVRSEDACGLSVPSDCINVKFVDTSAAPGAPQFSNVTCQSLLISWDYVDGAMSYRVFRKEGGCETGVQVGYEGDNTYLDTDVDPDTQYSYYVVATNPTCGNSEDGECASVTTAGLPSAPQNLAASSECTGVELVWDPVPDADSYTVLRSSNSSCNYPAPVGTATGPAYTDTPPNPNTSYYYTVRAENGCGQSPLPSCVEAMMLQIPDAPATITAVGECGGIQVAWDSVPGASSYEVVRTTNKTCTDIAVLGTVSTTAYFDGEATPGTLYGYKVRSRNSCGRSAYTACVKDSALTPAEPTITGASTNICPDTTVQLRTQTGMSNYQWYRNNRSIFGATSSVHYASLSGSYTVSYSNAEGCQGLSGYHSVTIVECGPPDVVYHSFTGLSEVDGDGDSQAEAGEKWQITVSLLNQGESSATSTEAVFGGVGLHVCNNPGSYGTIAAGMTADYTFQFIVNPAYYYGVHPCGASTAVDLTDLTSNGGAYSYSDNLSFTTLSIGDAGSGSGCDTHNALCGSLVPEVSGDASHHLKALKNGQNVDIFFEDLALSSYHIYVSAFPQTDSFQVDDYSYGQPRCSITGWVPSQNGMLLLEDFDLEGDIYGDTSKLFFLMSADAGIMTEGSLGFASSGTERDANDTCKR